MKPDDENEQFFRTWPRALFHISKGKEFLEEHLSVPGVYVLYRGDEPYYIGKTITRTLFKRLKAHALKPNTRYYNLWNYFSAFQIEDETERTKIEAILISAMPTANSAHPKLRRKKVDREIAKLLNDVQARMLTGTDDKSDEPDPESAEDED